MSIKGNVYITQNNQKIQFNAITTYESIIKNENSNITLEQEINQLKDCILKLSEILGNKIPDDVNTIERISNNINTFLTSLKEDNLNVIYGSNKNKPVIINREE